MKLDKHAIESLNPAELASKAEELVLSAHQKTGDSDARILALPQHWRAVCTTSKLDGEVNNGGFHQYFWNTEGKFNDATLEDLKHVGATAHHDLFVRAVAVYTKYNYAEEIKRAGDNLDGFTKGYKEKRFEDLDQEYYKLPDVGTQVGKFIKQHPELYSAAGKGN